MLSEDVCRLLTAYVDGELNERQRKAVERLVQRSPEARRLLDQLQTDANILRKLPRRQLPSDFALQVAGAITTRQLRPGQRRVWQPSPKILAWAGAAASVVLVVGLGSFYYLSPARNQQAAFRAGREQELAWAQPTPKREARVASRAALDKTAAAPSAAAPSAKSVPATIPSETGSSAKDQKVPRSTPVPAPAKPPERADKDAGPALAAAGGKAKDLVLVSPGLPSTFSLAELNREEQKKRLRLGMENGTGFHIELFCRGNGHALERMSTALSSQQVGLLVDETAEARLKQGGTEHYLLYAQEMTAAQLASVLERLASDDREAEERRRGSGEFESITVCALGVEDSRNLAVLLGSNPLLLPPPGLRGPSSLDLRGSVRERSPVTAKGSSLATNGTTNRGADRPLVSPQYSALLTSYDPGRPKTLTSSRVRQFLSTRKPPQRGAVQVFLVLRFAGG
jgi:anti-sigma factor RsiW